MLGVLHLPLTTSGGLNPSLMRARSHSGELVKIPQNKKPARAGPLFIGTHELFAFALFSFQRTRLTHKSVSGSCFRAALRELGTGSHAEYFSTTPRVGQAQLFHYVTTKRLSRLRTFFRLFFRPRLAEAGSKSTYYPIEGAYHRYPIHSVRRSATLKASRLVPAANDINVCGCFRLYEPTARLRHRKVGQTHAVWIHRDRRRFDHSLARPHNDAGDNRSLIA